MTKFQAPCAAALLLLLALAAAGCSTIDKMTGSTDDTVLPGTREDAIPGKSQFPDTAAPAERQPDAGTQDEAPATTPKSDCQAGQQDCPPAQSGDGAFSDPQ